MQMIIFNVWPMKPYMSIVLILSIKKQLIFDGSHVLDVIILHLQHFGYHIIATTVAILCGGLFSRFLSKFSDLLNFRLFFYKNKDLILIFTLLGKVSSFLNQNRVRVVIALGYHILIFIRITQD